ncbi:uncharacterized protein FIBRA_04746 [Fibroporia radiculosa]|uniref:Uncharacterized protein n=1 Tax=Fibroporia radiculosa TaxID=599839 RepID=J4HWP9_9APHY|nr:uncharacterized protein FIBRA_04746 [Fibroporia radiculosa]CCM02642.1 predicted protein [Fibroporia radiculosa]
MVSRPSKRSRVLRLEKAPRQHPAALTQPKGERILRDQQKIDKGKGRERVVSSPQAADRPSFPLAFKIVAGSYEKLLYGLEASSSVEGLSYKFSLKPVFIFPAHLSSVRAIAASPQGGKWLATGSGDEIIKVWDLRRRKEIGGLMQHEGSITHLEFPSRSHLLSASEDGTICLFHARDWAVLRVLKGHKGRVNSLAVHPSGKVALSVGKDKTLRMWDLMRGKGSASTKLGKEAEVVRWSIDGSLFVVLSQSTMDIYSIDMTLLHSITHPSRLHDVRFCRRVVGNGEVLLVAAEDKKVSVYDVSSDKTVIPNIIAEMIGHTNRVKAVEVLSVSLPTAYTIRSWTTLVSTISSDGRVRLYDMASVPVSTEGKIQLDAIAEYDTKGSRLTCLTMADGEVVDDANINGKRKRDDEDSDVDENALEEEILDEQNGGAVNSSCDDSEDEE